MKQFLATILCILSTHLSFSQSYIEIGPYKFALQQNKNNTWVPVNSRMISIPYFDTDSTFTATMVRPDPPYGESSLTVGRSVDSSILFPSFTDSIYITIDSLKKLHVDLVLNGMSCKIESYAAWAIGDETGYFEINGFWDKYILRYLLEDSEPYFKSGGKIIFTKITYPTETGLQSVDFALEFFLN